MESAAPSANAMIVSKTEKSVLFLSEILRSSGINQISALTSSGEARRLLMAKDFDLVIVDAPLPDEYGEDLSRFIVSKYDSQVIFAVQNEQYYEISAVCEEEGVLIISKPVNREMMWTVLSLAKSANSRIRRFKAENTKLKQKIEDIRIIDRAKCLLISYVNLSEQEAHRFIEKQAMDLRSSKRVIAEGIIKTYGN